VTDAGCEIRGFEPPERGLIDPRSPLTVKLGFPDVASHTPEVQAAARALEAIIREALPDIVVRYDPGDGLLAFGRSMQMRDLLFALIPHAGWVNLQLADGALLPNRHGLIEGTGKRIRHIKVRSADAARDPRVTAAVKAQIEGVRQP
jgi:hypothetical protein